MSVISKPSQRTPRQDLVGRRFGRLVVVAFTGEVRNRKTLWLCQCDCGKQAKIISGNLKSGRSQSCGCQRYAALSRGRASTRVHGMSRSPEYSTWHSMIRRCHNKKSRNFKHYGGRGITVCDEWRRSFEKFLAHLGRRPGAEYSLDRIDNDGNYEPGNVRWATATQQSNNRRTNYSVTAFGETRTISEWAAKSGIKKGCIQARLSRGWRPEDAVASKKPSGE